MAAAFPQPTRKANVVQRDSQLESQDECEDVINGDSKVCKRAPVKPLVSQQEVECVHSLDFQFVTAGMQPKSFVHPEAQMYMTIAFW